MKILLMNGGGIDSLAVAKAARAQYPDVVIESVHIRAGHLAEEKLAAGAKAIADAYCTNHTEYFLYKNDGNGPEPVKDLMMSLTKDGFVGIPFWALYLLICGFTYATRRGCDVLLTGLWADAYKPEMIAYLEKALACSNITPKTVTLEAPLFGKRRDLVAWIVEDDPVLEKTWSCNFDPPCGWCRKCTYRKTNNFPHGE